MEEACKFWHAMIEDYRKRLHQQPARRVSRDQGLQIVTAPLVQEWATALKSTTGAEYRKRAGFAAACRRQLS